MSPGHFRGQPAAGQRAAPKGQAKEEKMTSGIKRASKGQLLQIAGMITQSIPPEISAAEAQHWIDDPEGLRLAISEALMPSADTSVVIRPPLSEWWVLYAACKQQFSNPREFTEEHFPLEPPAPDDDKWRIYEHYFPETVKGDDAYARLKEMGFRTMSGLRRAMEFLARNQHLQLDHPVVITAAWRNFQDGRLYVPVFDGADGKRLVRLRPLASRFGEECGWLVLERASR